MHVHPGGLFREPYHSTEWLPDISRVLLRNPLVVPRINISRVPVEYCWKHAIASVTFPSSFRVTPLLYHASASSRSSSSHFLITCNCQLRFSQFTIRNSLVVPGLRYSRVYADRRIKACNCLIIFFEFFEGNSFVEPCSQ